MFGLTVDNEINLLLVHQSFAARYAEIVRKNYQNFSKWINWPRFCKTNHDFEEFIIKSLHECAQGKAMVCAIAYHNEIVGNCSYNVISSQLKKVEKKYMVQTR